MLKNRQARWLKLIIITGSLFGVGSLQLSYAQDFSPQSEDRIFSQDDALAYIEALEFSLTQTGSPVKFNEQQRQVIFNQLVRNFHLFPLNVQLNLSNARKTWNQYKVSWNVLSQEVKVAFVTDVLTLASSELLGLVPAPNQRNFEDTRDSFCAQFGGC